MHILIVEDEPEMAGLSTRGLEEESCQVSIARDGRAALELASVQAFDVILLDVMLPINAGSGWVYGFELAYVQHGTFLPGLLRGFGLGANYGYANSRASGLPGRSDSPRLLRSAPNTWNISPTYDLGRYSFRAGLSYNDANIFSYTYQDGTGGSTPTPGGVKGPFSDLYLYPHLQIDMQGSVRLPKGLTFIAYVLNANNEVFGFYQGSSPYMIQREYYRPTYAAGFRWSPGFEHK